MIRNEEYCGQVVDWHNMRWGKVSFTDVDMSIDFGQEWFTFVEIKYMTSPLTMGQKLHLEGICDAIYAGGKDAIAIHASHGATGKVKIVADRCLVQDVYDPMTKDWYSYNGVITLGKFMEGRHSDYQTYKEEG